VKKNFLRCKWKINLDSCKESNVAMVYTTIRQSFQGEKMEKRILIAEDEIRISNLLKLYLEREAFLVDVVNNGDEACEKALEGFYDVIILDILMPGKDGFAVLQEIRKTKETPVIMLSAKGEEQDLKRGQDLGANEYILKPFSPRDVVSKITGLLR
jgi:DNA-binding response OmpR family regulator